MLTLAPAYRNRWLALTCVAMLTIACMPTSASADARSDYLIQLLSASSQFRVRAQAAISLSAVQSEATVVDALSRALGDEHPAVRAAAANSLGRLAEARTLPSLRTAMRDPEEPVRTAASAAVKRIESMQTAARGTVIEAPQPAGPARYYIAIGAPASRATGVTDTDLRAANDGLRARVSEIDGVVLAPVDESNTAAQKVLKTRQLKGFYIESSVTSIENKPDGGVRAAVSLVVATYPGRDIRAMMNGAATVMGGGDIKAQALEAAFKSALRQLPQALVRD